MPIHMQLAVHSAAAAVDYNQRLNALLTIKLAYCNYTRKRYCRMLNIQALRSVKPRYQEILLARR